MAGTSPIKVVSGLDLTKLPKAAQVEIEKIQSRALSRGGDPDAAIADYIGINNKKRKNWDAPLYNAAEGEWVQQNGNAFVVLGRDRYAETTTGFGASGVYQCAAIDIVAGRKGWLAWSVTDDGGQKNADPDFKLDAARVYISQKSDIDTYLGLGMPKPPAPGEVGSLLMTDRSARAAAGFTTDNAPRSTVAIKADTLRFVSRENIMLVTRSDERNSQGGKTDNSFTGKYGIDLVGMNDFETLQPMVKGDNLVMCLKDITDAIQSLRSLVENYINYNNAFQRRVMFHTHPPAIPFQPILPSVQDLIPEGIQFVVKSALNVEVPAMLQHSQEVSNIESTYLDNKGGSRSKKYLLSNYNRSN